MRSGFRASSNDRLDHPVVRRPQISLVPDEFIILTIAESYKGEPLALNLFSGFMKESRSKIS